MSKKKFADRQAPQESKPTSRQKKTESSNTGLKSMANWFSALVFVLPLMISREALDPAITVRYIFLGIFTLLYLAFFYLLNRNSIKSAGLTRLVFMIGAGYVAWAVLGTFVAINKPAAAYEVLRYALILTVLYMVFQLTVREESRLIQISKVLLVVSIIQSVVGIFQFYGISFTELPGANAMPYGLMANRNLFGSAQALLLPFVVYVYFAGNKTWKGLAILSASMLVISLVLSQTRSAWLAVLAMTITAFVLVLIYSPQYRKKWMVATGAFLALSFILAFIIVSTDPVGEMSASVKERAIGLTKAVSDSSESSANVNERLAIWKKTASLISDHPITGVGLSNWKLNIGNYGTEGLVWAKGNFVPDRVHNIYLQTAAEAGYPGLILFAGMWILIGILGVMMIRKTVSEERKILGILMVAGMTGFAVDGLFSFPLERIEHCLYLTLMGGIILGLYLNSNPPENVRQSALPKWMIGGLMIISLANIIMGFKKHNFEVHMNYAKAYENEKRYVDMLNEAEGGKSSWVNIDMVGISLETKTSIAHRELKDYPSAIAESEKAAQHNPNSAMVYNNLGTVYTNMNETQKAIASYEKALKLAPEFDIVLMNLAFNYHAVGNYKASLEAFKKIKKLEDPYLISLYNEVQAKAGQVPVTDTLQKQ